MSSPPVAVPAGPHPPPRPSALPSSRYRHPGDVIRLISAGLLLAGAFPAPVLLAAAVAAVVAAAPWLSRPWRRTPTSRVSQAASIGTWPSQGPSGRMDGCIPVGGGG
jgi:hypothetical protein